jgi:hypothetical protein
LLQPLPIHFNAKTKGLKVAIFSSSLHGFAQELHIFDKIFAFLRFFVTLALARNTSTAMAADRTRQAGFGVESTRGAGSHPQN